jgi:hypothetical protein
MIRVSLLGEVSLKGNSQHRFWESWFTHSLDHSPCEKHCTSIIQIYFGKRGIVNILS